jgi:hypothetical protein
MRKNIKLAAVAVVLAVGAFVISPIAAQAVPPHADDTYRLTGSDQGGDAYGILADDGTVGKGGIFKQSGSKAKVVGGYWWETSAGDAHVCLDFVGLKNFPPTHHLCTVVVNHGSVMVTLPNGIQAALSVEANWVD